MSDDYVAALHNSVSPLYFFQREIVQNNKDKGFYDEPGDRYRNMLLLISEIIEMFESERTNSLMSEKIPKFTHAEEELADLFIRMLDYASHFNLRLFEAVVAKHLYNKTRPKKHGKKF